MESIQLVFDWPEDLALEVREERTIDAIHDDVQRRYRSENVFQLAWDGATRTVRIRDHHRRVLERTPPPPGVFDHQQIVRFVEECGPSFTVRDDGQVGELLPGLGDATRAAITLPPAFLAANPQVAGLVARLSTDAMIAAAAQAFWNPIVGGLAGGELPVEGETRIVMPVVVPAVGAPIDHLVQMSIAERWDDGRVQIRTVVAPVRDALPRVAEAIASPGLGGLRVTGAESLTVTDTETWPDTLVPVRVTVDRLVVAGATHPTTGLQSARTHERRTWTFRRVGRDDA